MPDFDAKDIITHLVEGLGLSNKEVVALFGHRTLGFLENDKINHEDSRWSLNPFVFDNNYYVEILNKNSFFVKTPSDKVLLNESQYLEHVEAFAKDQQLFFDEFTKVYQKICGFGSKNLLWEGSNENPEPKENRNFALI
jgi:hypothetical protein